MATRTTARSQQHSQPALVREMRPRSAAPRPDVILEANTAVDFLISLVGDTEPELLPQDLAWRDEARASLSPALRQDFERAFGPAGHDDEDEMKAISGWALMPLMVTKGTVKSSADALSFAASVTPAELLISFCSEGDELVATRGLAERYFAGEAELGGEVVAATPIHYRAGVERLLAEPDVELRALRRVLRAWQEKFVTIEDRIRRMQERDVAARRRDFDSLPLVDAVERATNGLRLSLDQRAGRLYLVPTYFGRPYNYTFEGGGWSMVAYPLADDALDGDPAAVPTDTVRLYRALGDESRMRILRHLADGDLYLTEVAERMGLSKPTAKHHLAQLRAAGLVTVTEAGNVTYYSLRRERVTQAGPDLARYLGVTPA